MKKFLVTILVLSFVFLLAQPVFSSTFEERREAWLERNGQKLSGGYLYSQADGQRAADEQGREDDAEWGRSYIFAWLEKGMYFDSAPSQKEYPGLRSVHGEIKTLAESSIGAAASTAGLTLLKLLYQSPYKEIIKGEICPNGNCYPYPDDLDKIYQAIKNGTNKSYGVYSRVLTGGCSTQPTRTIQSYLYALEEKETEFYCDISCPTWWTNPYTGQKYEKGKYYNTYEFTRDALYSYFENCLLKPATNEMDGAYTDILIKGLLTLHDLAGRPLERLNGEPDPEGVEMKKRAKMMLDFMMLEVGMDFSANHHGGAFGRHYQRGSVRNGSISTFIYPLLGLGPPLGAGEADSIAYTTDYRPAAIVVDITNIDDEPDNYWHLHKENNGVVYGSSFGKWTYVTKYFNLGGGSIGYNNRGSGDSWRLNLSSDDKSNPNSPYTGQPFMLWINRAAGDGQECPYWGYWFTACNQGGAQGGGPMYQYKNALLATLGGGAYLHVAQVGDFDKGQENLQQIYETQDQICSQDMPSYNHYYKVKGENFFCSYGDLCLAEECEVDYTKLDNNLDFTPRIAYWQGKVNQHTENGVWKTDLDGKSGAEIDKLTYCKKFYPETISLEEYKQETINTWQDAGSTDSNFLIDLLDRLGIIDQNKKFTSTKMSYKCVQPNDYQTGKQENICDIQDRNVNDYEECTTNCLKCRDLSADTEFYFENNYSINSSWNFFQEGKTALAIKNNGQAQALEVAIIGVDYSSFAEFKQTVLNNAELVGAAYFKTSKGDIIKARDDTAGLINNEPIFDFPFPRIETIYGYGDKEEGKLVEWQDNVMTVSKDDQSCVYDFNNWDYSGNACGEQIEPRFSRVDFNCDNEIDIQDFAILLSHWGEKGTILTNYQHPQCKSSSQGVKSLKLSNNSASLGIYDLGIFLSCWGNPKQESCYLIE